MTRAIPKATFPNETAIVSPFLTDCSWMAFWNGLASRGQAWTNRRT